MSGLPPLGTLIALAGLFAGLSVVCSAIGEWISGLLGWRSKTLADALRSMLQGATDPRGRDALACFHDHLLIRSLGRPDATAGPPRPVPAPRRGPWARLTRLVGVGHSDQASGRPVKSPPLPPPVTQGWPPKQGRGPSYIPPHAFADALLALIRPEEWRSPEPMTYNDFWRSVRDLPDSDLRSALEALGRDPGQDVTLVRRNIERWFASTMDRAKGWYKRRMLATSLAVSAALCLALGIDAVELARSLQVCITTPEAESAFTARRAGDGESEPVTRIHLPGPSKLGDGVSVARSGRIAGASDRIAVAGSSPVERACLDALRRLPGLMLATVLVAMGTPFWFDILKSFAEIRLAGTRPDGADRNPPA